MAIRQQRATQSRRQKPGAQNPNPAPVITLWISNDTANLTVKLNVPRTQLVKVGNPQWKAVGADALPVSSALTDTGDPDWPTSLGLHYGVSLAADETFELPAYDPAIRSTFGGFIPPTNIVGLPIPPTTFPWDIVSITGNVMSIICAASANSITLPVAAQFTLDGTGPASTIARTGENTFDVTLTGSPGTGDTITWTYITGTCYDQEGGQAAGGTKTVP